MNEQRSHTISEFSPAPWSAAPYKVEAGADPDDFGSWAVFDARPDTLPLAILGHRRDGHGGFRKSVGDHAKLIAKAPQMFAELRTTLAWLKERMPCTTGKCCEDIRVRIAAIEALTDEEVSK